MDYTSVYVNGSQITTNFQDDSALEYRLGQEPSIQAFWDTLTEHQRQDMLTLDIGQLQQAALERTKAIDANSGKQRHTSWHSLCCYYCADSMRSYSCACSHTAVRHRIVAGTCQ